MNLFFTKFISLLFFCILFLNGISQTPSTENNSKQKILLHRGTKLLNLNSYDEFSITWNQSSRGQDSISTLIFSDQITYKHDTLLVVPEDMSIFNYMDTVNAYAENKDYPKTTTVTIKIPVKEIESIKAKKQPLAKISGGIAAVSYVVLMCSPFIAMNQNQSVSDFGVGLFLVSAPILAVSWSINGIYAKKRFHFDRERTHKETWKFE